MSKLIIDVHVEFLKRAVQVFLKVREGNVKWLQSFVISMVVRDLWTRNNTWLQESEARQKTKEELAKLCEQAGVEIDDLEAFLSNVMKSGIL